MLEMFPGDHLQLMYHFWLMKEFVVGETPWFHDLYEFNRGDDAEREWVRPYFVPFSLLFAGFSGLGGNAFGYNATLFVSVWLTLLGSWWLARRFVGNHGLALAASIIGIVFCYRWVSALGGHPAGFALMWLPWLWLGIDGFVPSGLNHRPSGTLRDGGLVAISLLGCAAGDLQVLGFALLAPLGMWLVSYLHHRKIPKLDRFGASVSRMTLLAHAVALLGFLLAGTFAVVTSQGFAGTSLEDGQPEIAVALASPVWTDWFRWFGTDAAAHAFFGVALTVACLVFLSFGVRRGATRLPTILVAIGLILGLLVGLGTNGPIIGGVRDLLQGEVDLLRQPTKAHLAFPVLLTVFFAMGASVVPRKLFAVIVGLVLAEQLVQVRPFLSELADNPVYQEVVRDGGERVLVVPLRPGDSAFDSIQQYHAMRSRLKFVNGYSPRVPDAWTHSAFEPLRTVNQGVLLADQIGLLRKMGVSHVVYDESQARDDAFDFPPALVRERLQLNPALELLAHEGNIWSFRIGEAASTRIGFRPDHLFPARAVELEDCLTKGGSVYIREDTGSMFEKYLEMKDVGTVLAAPPPGHLPPLLQSGSSVLVRMRGEGVVALQAGDETTSVHHRSSAWSWRRIQPRLGDSLSPETFTLRLDAGALDLDGYLVLADSERLPCKGMTIPAADGFHRAALGRDNALRFDPGRVPTAYPSWEAVRVPCEPGRYKLTWTGEADDASTSGFGRFEIFTDPDERQEVSVASASGVGTFIVPDDRPLQIQFFFSGRAAIVLNHVAFSRDER